MCTKGFGVAMVLYLQRSCYNYCDVGIDISLCTLESLFATTTSERQNRETLTDNYDIISLVALLKTFSLFLLLIIECHCLLYRLHL